jgi:hypothetical protein
VLHGVENLFPSSTKYLGCFLPRKPASPAGQEQHVGSGQRPLAVAQGNFFDDDRTTAAAIDTPHRIKQKNQKSPERNEFKTALRQLIISGGGLMAARTNCRRTLSRTNIDLNAPVIRAEAGLLVNESPENGDIGLESLMSCSMKVETGEDEN